MFQSKRYKDAVRDRDSLLAVTRLLQTDTFRLNNQNKTFLKEIRRITGEYAFLKKNYTSLDSSCTSLNNQYTALKNEQAKLQAAYKFYSDSMEKRLTALNEELRSKSIELNAKSDELNSKSNELNTKSNELKSKSDELKSKSDELNNKTSELNIRTTELKVKPEETNNKVSNQNQRNPQLIKLETVLLSQDSVTRDLYKSLLKAYNGYNPDELSVKMSNGKVRVSINNKLLFKPGTMTIDDKGRKTLKKLALLLNRYDDLDIAIEGHTDSIPVKNTSYKDNWDLSAIRATSVARVLNEEYDITPIKLFPTGRGEFFPIASNEDVQGRAKNKRVDIILSPEMDEIYREMEKK
jgi:chemotaxis protein MotB